MKQIPGPADWFAAQPVIHSPNPCSWITTTRTGSGRAIAGISSTVPACREPDARWCVDLTVARRDVRTMMQTGPPRASGTKTARACGRWEALLVFFDFPAEHWDHLRTSIPIESAFATVRHRTVRTGFRQARVVSEHAKGPFSRHECRPVSCLTIASKFGADAPMPRLLSIRDVESGITRAG